MRFEAGQVGVIGGQAAPGCDDRLPPPRQFLNDLPLPFAKSLLALLLKNVNDRFPRPRLDHRVRVQKGKMQNICDQPPDGRFARTHEADEGEILDGTGVVHSYQLPD